MFQCQVKKRLAMGMDLDMEKKSAVSRQSSVLGTAVDGEISIFFRLITCLLC